MSLYEFVFNILDESKLLISNIKCNNEDNKVIKKEQRGRRKLRECMKIRTKLFSRIHYHA